MATPEENIPERFFGPIWDQIKTFFQAQFESVWTGAVDRAPVFGGALVDAIVEAIGDVEVTAWENMLNTYQSAGLIDSETSSELIKLKDITPPFDFIAYIGVAMMLAQQYVSGTSMAISGGFRQGLNTRYSPYPPTPNEVMGAAFVAPERTGEVRHAMKRAGLSEEDIDLLFLSRYRLYDEDRVKDLWLRGAIDDNRLYERMRELGYTDTRIQEIIKTWEAIPPITDIITMAYRGSFDPANRQKWPWAFDAPGAFVQWAEKQGVTREWAERYWYMHWTQPGVREMFDMLHRGAISEGDLDHTMRVIGFSDYWIEKVKAITYNPYTRVDVRRMHELGVLDDRELYSAYLDLGYDGEKARNMVDFTLRYNARNEIDLTRGQILKGYRERAIPRQEALDLLMEIGVNRNAAEYLLDFEDYLFEKELIDDTIDNIRDRFVQNLISYYDARDRLMALNLPARQIEVLLDKWEIKRWKAMKVPSKTDLDKFLRAKIITEDQWRAEMDRLGYAAAYIDWYLALTRAKK